MITFNSSKTPAIPACRGPDTQTPTSRVEYVDISKIFFAHNYCSSQHIREIKEDLISKKVKVYDKKTDSFTYKYNQGTSVFSEKESFPAVKTKFGYLIQDGNDEVLAGSLLKSEKVPVHVIENIENMHEKFLWKYLKKQNYVYQDNIDKAEQLGFPVDNPNYYFVQKTKATADINYKLTGPDHPLVVISNYTSRFTEVKIADFMTKNGISYKYSMGKPPLETLRKLQDMLEENPIRDVMEISKGTHIKNILIVG